MSLDEKSSIQNHNEALAHVHPFPLARRSRHAVDDAFDLETFGEVDEALFPAGDAIEEMFGLDDLELVEAELMAGRRGELAIGRMDRPGEDGAEAARLLRAFGHIELQLIETLLIEGEHALGAMHFKADQVLAAPGGAARGEHAGNAGFEPHDGMGDVLVLDLAHLSCTRHRALLHHRFHIGRDGGDVADQQMREAHQMAGDVTEGP